MTGIDDPTLYAASGSALAVVKIPGRRTPRRPSTGPSGCPAPLERVAFNPASQLVHVLGRTPDGTAATVYVVEPRGNAVFADAVLPVRPGRPGRSTRPPAYPSADRQQLLVFAADGAGAAVDIGQHAFAWRAPGRGRRAP